MRTVQDLLERVKSQESRLGISRHGAWFRGHYDREWSLTPTLFRYTNGPKHERNIFSTFCKEAPISRVQSHDDLEILARMQHHGVPTRLLDWTESISTALFFATTYPLRRQVGNPCIWLLNPFRLNEASTGRSVIFDNTDVLEDLRGHKVEYFPAIRDQLWPFENPVAIYSPWSNERISRQQGAFTIHGTLARPLNEAAPRAAKKIDIPHQLVAPIREHLLVNGIGFHSLFPDHDGLGKTIRHRFKLY